MKRLFVLFLILFVASIFTSNAYAASLAEVLEWKYGACSGTKQANESDTSPNPKMVIAYWKCEAPQPSDAQIAIDTQEYQAYLAQAELDKKAKKDAALLKLKVTEQDFLDILDYFGVEHK